MKKITVIGAGGQMGQWFTKYFASEGFEVTGYDSENKVTGKDVKISESLVNIPSYCKNTNTSEIEIMEKIAVIISEIHKFHHYKFIKDDYLSFVNCIIKKFLSKTIDIDGFINKINNDHFEERIKNMSITRMVNYLTS